ncbi:methyltransferase type 12, partial [Metarhizium brunneum ARSEF 3297]
MNRAAWDERVPSANHRKYVASADYQVRNYISSVHFIGNVVQFDRPLLGDTTGLNCVHLQCHIGTDMLGLARLGAASVTGLDFKFWGSNYSGAQTGRFDGWRRRREAQVRRGLGVTGADGPAARYV